MGRVKRIWYLSPMRAAKVQVSLRIRAVSPEPPLLAHTSSEPRGTFEQKAWSLLPLNGWACAVKICHDGMLENTNSLDAPHMIAFIFLCCYWMVLLCKKLQTFLVFTSHSTICHIPFFKLQRTLVPKLRLEVLIVGWPRVSELNVIFL